MDINNYREPCTICKTPISPNAMGFKDVNCYEVKCPYCGLVDMTENMKAILEANPYFPNLSFWIREQNDVNDIVPVLTEDKIQEYFNIPDKLLRNRYEVFIQDSAKEKEIVFYDDNYNTENIDLCKITWSKTNNDLRILINKALTENHISLKAQYTDRTTYIITFDGLEYLESLGYQTVSNKIFMAFQFNDEMKKQFEGPIRRAVADASENKLEAVRVSSSTTDHDTKIDDELIAMIKSSKAVIADFTGNRTAVYYEAGYAMGLGIPVIWTCRDTDIDDLSFDTRQYPHIIWKDEDDLYKQVVNRLKAKIL